MRVRIVEEHVTTSRHTYLVDWPDGMPYHAPGAGDAPWKEIRNEPLGTTRTLRSFEEVDARDRKSRRGRRLRART